MYQINGQKETWLAKIAGSGSSKYFIPVFPHTGPQNARVGRNQHTHSHTHTLTDSQKSVSANVRFLFPIQICFSISCCFTPVETPKHTYINWMGRRGGRSHFTKSMQSLPNCLLWKADFRVTNLFRNLENYL